MKNFRALAYDVSKTTNWELKVIGFSFKALLLLLLLLFYSILGMLGHFRLLLDQTVNSFHLG
jgi:hypothetical protein